MKNFTGIWLKFLAFLCLLVANHAGATPYVNRCGNADCSVPISRAKTLVRYNAPKEGHVSFAKGTEVDVFIKGNKLWSVKVGDKVGFAPSSFLKEFKVLIPSEALLNVADNVAPESVVVKSTQLDAVDLPVAKTAEIPAGIGSLLSFPSMAAAESVEGQEKSVPSPSSPQYEVVDGTTFWMDPMPLSESGQPAIPYSNDNSDVEPLVSENVSEPSAETLQSVVTPLESSGIAANEGPSVSASDAPLNSQEVNEAPSVEVPPTPIPSLNDVTPPSYVDGHHESATDASTEASTEAVQEVTTQAPEEATKEASSEDATGNPSEAAAEVTSETPVEATNETPVEDTSETPVETTSETPVETTESPEIQPTEASLMSNLWNTVFNSGDGNEENSQENQEEEEEEGEEDEDEGEEEEEEEDSTEAGLIGAPEAPVQAVESSSATPPSAENLAENAVVKNIPHLAATSPNKLEVSFGESDNFDNSRSVRQTETFSEEIPSGKDTAADAQVSSKPQPASTTEPDLVVEHSVGKVPGEDPQVLQDSENLKQEVEVQKQTETESVIQEEEQNRLKEEEEQKRKQVEEDELKRKQEEEEQKRKQEEEEQKRIQEEEEEQKRKQEEEEQKRKQEEEERKRQKEEEQKRKQEEEQKRKQEEEEERRQREERRRRKDEEFLKVLEREREIAADQRRYAEEQRRLADERRREEERRALQEEENRKSLAAEHALWLENQEKQRIREEEIKKEREEAKLKETQENLEREKRNVGAEDNLSQGSSEPNSEEESSAGGTFSWLFGLFGSSAVPESIESEVPADTSVKQEAQPEIKPIPSALPEHHHEHPPVWSSEEQTMCSVSDARCGVKESKAEPEASSIFMGIETPSLDVILLRLVATAVALFLGASSFYFIRKKNVDSFLVAKINDLEKQLLVASKEAVILREEALTLDASVNAEEVSLLQEELESSRILRVDLEEQVSTLERELEEATETGIELNKLLTETLEASKGKAHAGLAASVERLQQQLNSQRDKVDSLTRSLTSTSAENENFKSVVAESKERIAALEAELAAAADIANNIRKEKEEANLLAAQELQQVQSRLEEALSSKVLEESRLGSELSALKLKYETLRSALSMKDAEVKALQDTLKELESGETDQLLDVSKVKAEIEHTKKERDVYLEKYQEEEKARKDNEERLDKMSETLKKLLEKVDFAEKNKEEAETRLTVLSNYFKEKEEQLQKELGLKEAIVAQHRGDEGTVIKHLQLLQEEVSSYRAQNESLKQEILDQERDFKGQMAALEKKAHDNWMTARQAERRLEDSRQEAAQLRNRLTHVEKSNADPNTRLDANGEGGVVSPVMMMPLPPLGDMEASPPLPPFMFSPPPYPPPFMPPPLPPHPMGRPPPLGRMSSPPPPLGQFSPPPPPYDCLDRSSRSRSPSPPPHRYRHRSPPLSQQWDAPPSGFRPVPKPSPKKPNDQREHKGSMHNSGHLNESVDKSREHV